MVNPKRVQVLNIATARSSYSAHLFYERIITDLVLKLVEYPDGLIIEILAPTDQACKT